MVRVLFHSDRDGELFSLPSGVFVWKFELSFCSCCVVQAGVSILHGAFPVLGFPSSVLYKCKVEIKALWISERGMGT